MKKQFLVILLTTIILAACGGNDLSSLVSQATNTIDPADARATQRQPTLWAGQTQNALKEETANNYFTEVVVDLNIAVATGTARRQTLAAMTQKALLTPTHSATPTITPTPTINPTPTEITYVRDATPYINPSFQISADNIHQMIELARWGYGSIQQVEHSPNGKFMLVQSAIGVHAYWAGTLTEYWYFEKPSGASSIVISPNNEYVAIGTFDGSIYMVSLDDGYILDHKKGYSGKIISLAFSSIGNFLASSSSDQTFRLWQVDSDGKISTYKDDIQMEHEVTKLQFIDNDRLLQLSSWNYERGDSYYFWVINGWFLADEIMALESTDHYFPTNKFTFADGMIQYLDEMFFPSSLDIWDGYVTSPTFSNDGTLFAAGIETGAVKVYRVSDQSLILDTENEETSFSKLAKFQFNSFPGPEAIENIIFTPDDSIIIFINGYGDIELWDLRSGLRVAEAKGDGRILKVSPNGSYFISYDWNDLGMFSITDGKEIDHLSDIALNNTPHFFQNGTIYLAGKIFSDKNIQVVDWPVGEQFIGFSQDGRYVYTSVPRWWIKKRQLENMALVSQIELEQPDLESRYGFEEAWEFGGDWEVSPTGHEVRLVPWNYPSLIWNLDDGTYQGYTKDTYFGMYSPNGEYFAFSGPFGFYIYQGNLPIYSGDEIFTFSFDGGLAYSFDNNYLAIRGDNSVWIFDLETHHIINQIDFDDYSYGAVAFSPGGSLLAYSYKDTVYIWDMIEGKVIYSFNAHFESIISLVFSPDGRLLATTSDDGTVRLWGILP